MSYTDEFSHRAIVRQDGYACPHQLITVIEAMEYDFAMWLIENMKYSRWEINARHRYWRKLSMPSELSNWFQLQREVCEDSM